MAEIIKNVSIAPLTVYDSGELIQQNGTTFVSYDAMVAKGLIKTPETVPTMLDFNAQVAKNMNNTPTVSKAVWTGAGSAIASGASFSPFSQASGLTLTGSYLDHVLSSGTRIGLKILPIENTDNNYLLFATLKLTWSGWAANGQQVQSAYINMMNLQSPTPITEERYRMATEQTGASMQMANIISHLNGPSDFKIVNGFNITINNSATSGTLTLTSAELTIYHTIVL